jgi:DNA-directed RNA polymerase subunit K/omega
MVNRPLSVGRFEFAVLCGLRAAQLSRGCVALVPVNGHKLTTTAQIEVAEFKIAREVAASDLLVPAPSDT